MRLEAQHKSTRTSCVVDIIVVVMTLLCLMLDTLGPGAMNSDLNRLCYHHYIHVLDPISQVVVTYYVL